MSDCDVCIGGYEDGISELFSESRPKARKLHRCSECDKAINRGDQYQRTSGKSDGEFWTFITCLLCAEIRKVFSCNEGELLGGMLWEQMRDYAFPTLKTSSPCFRELSPDAKAEVIRRWQIWKGLTR